MSETSREYILAIDLGTSGPKVALMTTTGDPVACEFEPTSLQLLPGGGAEQDPDDWWRAIKKATQKVHQKAQVLPECIKAVCCTTQWSGTVPVDRAGNHLMNAIIWMDTRGASHLGKIKGIGPKIEGYSIPRLIKWIRLTGGIFGHSGKDPIAHILYIKDQHRRIYDNTYKFLEPKDYLNLRLTGVYKASYCSICLHWLTDNRNIKEVKYHPGLIKKTGMDLEKLPDLLPAVDILGTIKQDVAAELGVSKHAQVVMGTPDVQSAALGSGAVRDGEGHIYIGTSSWLTCHVPHKKTDLFHNMATLPSAIPDRYLIANEQETAGASLNWLIDSVLYPADKMSAGPKPNDAHLLLNQLASDVMPGSSGVIYTPWLAGERSPVDDHFIRGGFHNLSLTTTRAQMCRAVLEGVAFNSRWLLKHVEKLAGSKMDTINMIGGGAKSELWCQIYADIMDRTICQLEDPIEANVRGAGFLGAVALGEMDFSDIPNRVKIAKTFEPNQKNRAIYQEMFNEYLRIYKANKPIHHRLNRKR